MGLYIEAMTFAAIEKEEVNPPKTMEEFESQNPGKALVCSVWNTHWGGFFANLYCTHRDLSDFTRSDDTREKKWYIIDKEEAEKHAR